jgi:hypothetical protein
MMKKLKKSGSHLSMENLGLEEEEDDAERGSDEKQAPLLQAESEHVTLHPVYVLQ